MWKLNISDIRGGHQPVKKYFWATASQRYNTDIWWPRRQNLWQVSTLFKKKKSNLCTASFQKSLVCGKSEWKYTGLRLQLGTDDDPKALFPVYPRGFLKKNTCFYLLCSAIGEFFISPQLLFNEFVLRKGCFVSGSC